MCRLEPSRKQQSKVIQESETKWVKDIQLQYFVSLQFTLGRDESLNLISYSNFDQQ